MHVEGTDENKNASDTPNTESSWKYIEIQRNTNAGKDESGKSRHGLLRKNMKAICVEEREKFYKILWGTTDANYAYINKKDAILGEAVEKSILQRAIKIAKAFLKAGTVDGEIFHGSWCVQFIYYLMKASGNKNLPSFKGSKVSALYNAIDEKKIRVANGDFDIHPMPGDIIFYSTEGNKAENIYHHVGFIIEVDGNTITTIEGNLSNKVQRKSYDYRKASKDFSELPINKFKIFACGSPEW